MFNRSLSSVALALLLLTACWPPEAHAQQPVSQGPAASQTGWMFNFAPYLWLPTAHVSLNYNLPDNLGARLPTDVSSGPGDYLSKLDAAAAFAADVRNGPFSLLTDFMARILADSFQPGAKVSEVALRHGVNRGLLWTWRRQVRKQVADGQPAFVPIRIANEAAAEPMLAAGKQHEAAGMATMEDAKGQQAAGSIDIEIGGARVRVRGSVDAAALRQVLTHLGRRS